jgi:glyoxylase-like metal-dependent hydrolase (beta-lactamase superfamily II)
MQILLQFFAGDVATVWPSEATEEEKKNRSVPRVEIFKMASGLEYIIHDIDEHNHIIGRARFNGHIKVSEMMSVEGFGGFSIHDDPQTIENAKKVVKKVGDYNEDDDSFSSSDLFESPVVALGPPSFHPPSFGVTTLGNSHGFDKSGSVSGYVLWVNGRGIMIDPPPYSSATLEREGIRPRTIVGIILTHCHADHDAGAFQKVLTGSPVVVITTPTIYKSFIRKYAALASVSPALLRHCHRYKPAIIGEALRFQGANFRFQYSLHSIPCVGFRVDWRGRSIVFTGDHMNKPDALDKLQADGVLTKARADDLRNLPLQETDLLLHEAGAPPIHTPLEVLLKLPERVRKRLYVVHTSNIPEEYDLKIAPTGTAGTLRLDTVPGVANTYKQRAVRSSHIADDELIQSSPWGSTSDEYEIDAESAASKEEMDVQSMQYAMTTSFTGTNKKQIRHSITDMGHPTVPLVGMRPASSTDAWFILNLLSAVPFMSR